MLFGLFKRGDRGDNPGHSSSREDDGKKNVDVQVDDKPVAGKSFDDTGKETVNKKSIGSRDTDVVKILRLKIIYDGGIHEYSFESTDIKETCFTAYRDFLTWYYNRDRSDRFVMESNRNIGKVNCMVHECFLRKLITFVETIEEPVK